MPRALRAFGIIPGQWACPRLAGPRARGRDVPRICHPSEVGAVTLEEPGLPRWKQLAVWSVVVRSSPSFSSPGGGSTTKRTRSSTQPPTATTYSPASTSSSRGVWPSTAPPRQIRGSDEAMAGLAGRRPGRGRLGRGSGRFLGVHESLVRASAAGRGGRSCAITPARSSLSLVA
jgi:hypothetical protein